MQTTTLYFAEGSADKQYGVAIIPVDGGFDVVATYGRRGGAMATDKKNKVGALNAAAATKLYDRVVREKAAKGYRPGPDATAQALVSDVASIAPPVLSAAAAADVAPQLLTPLDEAAAARVVIDDAYWLQRKYDGKRVLLRANGGTVVAFNRKGLPCPIPQPVMDAAMELATLRLLGSGDALASYVLDGELVGEVLWVFDLLSLNGVDTRKLPYSQRYEGLLAILVSLGNIALPIAPTARTRKEKLAMIEDLTASRAEGYVLKNWSHPYTAGRSNSQFKRKFWAEASVLCAGQHEGKQSVAIALLDENGDPIPVGHVTLAPSDEIPPVGAVLSVRYLYVAHVGGSLYQAIYGGVRDDQDASDCSLSQLKYRGQ